MTIKQKIVSLAIFHSIILCCWAFSQSDRSKTTVSSAVVQATVISLPETETLIYNGGYGSSMAYNEADGLFYLLTDRGPNADGATPESKVFPVPSFVPHIGKFRLQNGELVLVEKIELKDKDGSYFSGIPNAKGDGSTNETAYNLKGEIIANDNRRGLDTEGLTIAPDGSFWVSDEYGPYILHFDAKGNLIEEFSPFNGGLPKHYATRRPNRGMEGLTLSKDGKTLYGAMQSPLYYPSKETKDKSTVVRIVSISLKDKKVGEYIYLLDGPKYVVSEIETINDNEFLVLERDGEFSVNGKGFKKIFKINILQASNIAADPRPFETMSAATLAENNIHPVKKELFLDILAAIPDYPHEKPEGIALINNNRTLCIVNDDDFGIDAPTIPNGTIIPKLAPNGALERTVINFVEVGE
jgi:hypothetical protein